MKKEVCDCGCNCGEMPKLLTVIIVVLLAGVLVAVAFMAGQNATPTSVVLNSDGTNADIKSLSVSGSVTKMVSPDKVDIILSVETLDKSAQKSQSDNAVIADKVKFALESLSSVRTEVKTVSYSVNEEYEWNDYLKKSESTGYRTVNQIQVTLSGDNTSKAGTVIDVAVEAGANRVSSISFGLSKEKELEIRKTALNEASATAKAKAESIASGLGISIGQVRSVSESSFYYTPNYANYDMVKASAGSIEAATPITAGDVEVNASVSVSFELK